MADARDLDAARRLVDDIAAQAAEDEGLRQRLIQAPRATLGQLKVPEEMLDDVGRELVEAACTYSCWATCLYTSKTRVVGLTPTDRARQRAAELLVRVQSDPTFADRLRASPEATLKEAGLEAQHAEDVLRESGAVMGTCGVTCIITCIWTDTPPAPSVPKSVRTQAQGLVDALKADADLRKRIQDDPEAVIRAHGLPVGATEDFMREVSEMPGALGLGCGNTCKNTCNWTCLFSGS